MTGETYSIEQLVTARQLHMVFHRLRASLLLTVAVSALFSGLLTPYFDSQGLFEWFVIVQSLSAVRYVLAYRYLNSRVTPAQNAHWSRLFTATTMLAGASWAFGAVRLMPAAGHQETMLLLLPLLCVCSVAVGTLAGRFYALLYFLLAVLLPAIVVLSFSGGSVELLAAAILIAGLLALITTGHRSNATNTLLIRTELELHESIAATASAQQAAEASSRAKSQFLANMSHEVRTPLNGILGMSELLAASTLGPQQSKYVEVLRQSAVHLLQIVNEILDLSKIEAGKIELNREEFDVVALVEQTAALVRPNALRKGLTFTVEIAGAVPRRVIGDPARLRQVLLNLLTNAIKFTASGFVAVRATTMAGDAPCQLQFEVADSGIGIELAQMSRVFDAFTQADESTTRRFGGTGLGLAVSRQLTQLMGGEISLQSTPGAGSTFRFYVRLTLPQPAAADQSPQRDERSAPRNKPASEAPRSKPSHRGVS